MSTRADTFDLAGLRLTPGAGRRLELSVPLGSFELGGERYESRPPLVPIVLDVSRTTGSGYALRLTFTVGLSGPCMRCLGEAAPELAIEAREISQPGAGEELESPYVGGTPPSELDLRGWARDALVLALPALIVCSADCRGLCPVCGADLNAAGPEHGHQPEPDPRWAKLSQLRFDES